MKVIHATLVAAGLLTAQTALAQTATDTGPTGPTPGWYAGLGVGYDSIGAHSLTLNGGKGRIKFKDGWAIAGSAGYEWEQGFRTELELSHREDKAKDFFANDIPVTGKQKDTSLMANLLLDIRTGTNWTPYIGAGAGVSWLQWDQFQGKGSPTIYDGTNTRFAWQGIAGIAVQVSRPISVSLDFRYKGVDGNHFGSTTPGSTVGNYDARTKTVMLSFRYSFGTTPAPMNASSPPPPPAPMAAAPAPARPAPPAADQKFLVFFDFDRSNLRADSEKIVTEAADFAKKTGHAHIVTTGHTDTSGADAYNMALSERRAKTVEKELNKLGIPDSQVDVRWKGESEPLVQTGDGVKEPQNRRVEIVIE